MKLPGQEITESSKSITSNFTNTIKKNNKINEDSTEESQKEENKIINQVRSFKRKLTRKATPPGKEFSNANIRKSKINPEVDSPKISLRQFLNKRNSQKFVNMHIVSVANK